MLIRPRILRTLAVIPFLIGVASPVSRAQQPPLQLSDFITFILPDAGPKPEPHDPLAGLTGGGGSAVEQPTDALVYQDGKTTALCRQGKHPWNLRARNHPDRGAHRSRRQAAEADDQHRQHAPEHRDAAAGQARRDADHLQMPGLRGQSVPGLPGNASRPSGTISRVSEPYTFSSAMNHP